MPILEYRCFKHGVFEIFNGTGSDEARCPTCYQPARKIVSLPAPAHIVEHKRLQYGSGSMGRVIPGRETGGLDLFIPSGGCMDKDEIDDVASAAIEKEKSRVKSLKGHPRSANQEAIGAITNLAYRTKPKDRIRVMKEAITESGMDRSIKVA